MSRPKIAALVDEPSAGALVIAAPAPGRIRWQRLEGEVVVTGSRLGILVENERNFDLILPRCSPVQVAEVLLPNPWTPCSHGQVLAKLVQPSAEQLAARETQGEGRDDLFSVASPTHGTFYRRPSPESPAYIEEGDTIVRGQTLGLVEVMKCFSPIAFEPPAGTESARVEEICAQDGAEVRAEQMLVRVALT